MLKGKMHHKDSTGRTGAIEAGDVQWMRAGRGILHEEMPERTDDKLDGFQLWVNLSAKDKMNTASYQEYAAKDITTFEHEGHMIRLISGELFGQCGVVRHISQQPTYADISLAQGTLKIELAEEHNAFVCVFEDDLEVVHDESENAIVTSPQLAVLGPGKTLILKTEAAARCLLIAGKPNNEPVVRSGPFVMNTRAEIAQTWREIRDGEFPPSS
jgi:redox-sensitive bicupin YhaK (pirin superfamily)